MPTKRQKLRSIIKLPNKNDKKITCNNRFVDVCINKDFSVVQRKVVEIIHIQTDMQNLKRRQSNAFAKEHIEEQ